MLGKMLITLLKQIGFKNFNKQTQKLKDLCKFCLTLICQR